MLVKFLKGSLIMASIVTLSRGDIMNTMLMIAVLILLTKSES